MSQEVMIAGALFSDVPSIQVPDSQGNFHPFTDVSDTTAAAADVATGKYFYAADGTRTEGTSSGGGGGGFEYETGVWQPEEDTSDAWIPFARTHDTPPSIVYVGKVGSDETFSDTNTKINLLIVNYERLIGFGLKRSNSTVVYGTSTGYGRNTGTTANEQSNRITIPDTDSSSSATNKMRYWVNESSFRFIDGSTYKAEGGASYKWVAIWAEV
jgi:hypothetical protein